MGLKESGLRASVRSVSTVVPAFFDVAITDTNSPINEGDVLVVDYSVDNTGDSFETQDIRLEIDSVQEDADLDVSLSGGASDSGTLEWDTTGQDADTYEATVLSDDDSDTVTVEIPDAFFDVAIQSTNSPVEEGETLNVDYLVDNTGGVEDTQDIRLEIDNTQEDVDTDVTLDSDTSTTGTLQWDTTDESADTYSATVLSDDDSDSVTVEIEAAIPDSIAEHMDLFYAMDEGEGENLNDSIGSIDGTLEGAGWDFDSDFDEVTTYDGSDYRYLSDSSLDASGTFSYGFWIYIDNVPDRSRLFFIGDTPEDGRGMDNGVAIYFRSDGRFRNNNYDSGSEGVPTSTSGEELKDQWVFYGISADSSSDTSTIYQFNTDELRASNSYSGDSIGEPNNIRIAGGYDPEDENALDGRVAMVMASKKEVTESEWEEIHSETKPE